MAVAKKHECRTKHGRILNWRAERSDIRDLILQAVPNLPRARTLKDKLPPVFDQGELGSCTGNGLGGIVDFNNPGFIASRLFIYYCERVIEGTVRQDAGAEIRDGIKALAKSGVCREDVWPYKISKFKTKPNKAAFAEAEKYQILKYQRVTDLAGIKTAIASGLPVVFGTTWYDSYDSDHVTATGDFPALTGRERPEGGHCMYLFGYDDDHGRVYGRNSWSEDWGDKGNFSFPYSTVPQFDDCWVIQSQELGK